MKFSNSVATALLALAWTGASILPAQAENGPGNSGDDQIVTCRVYNGNDAAAEPKPLTIDLVIGDSPRTVRLNSDLSINGHFEITLRVVKFAPELGGNYRLQITSSAVENTQQKAISYINSTVPSFSGRTWLFDKTSGNLKSTYVDYDCSRKQ